MLKLAHIAIATGLAGAAAERPVANVTSPDAFNLNGERTSAVGVSSWPLVVGDEVATLTSTVLIRFSDKSLIAIDKESSLKLEKANQDIIVRLTTGSMRFKVEPGARIQVFAGNQRLINGGDAENGVEIRKGKVVLSKKSGPPLQPPGPPPAKPAGRSAGE
jgi:hypothetical protein